MKNIKFLLTAAVATAIFGCANNDEYNTPDINSEASGECITITATKAVADITTAATAAAQQYTDDDVIEAYITGSDEGGNIFKNVHLVNTDNTIGFSIPVDAYNTYTKFEPGRKVYVNLKDKYFAKANGATVIGSLYNNVTPLDPSDDAVGRISLVEYENVIKRGCEKVDENTLVKHLTVAQAKNDQYLNMLIELDGVQLSDVSVGKNYFDASINNLGSATNHQLGDITGQNIILRASRYATFAANKIPSGSGKVRGILTKFGSDYQFMIRTLNDVMLDQPRFDANPPIVGNNITYGLYNENFESYAANNRIFPKAVNDPAIGSRFWEVKSFSNNKYIQMTSFGGAAEANRTLFIVPVDMTLANTLQFQTKAGYDNGAVLKVYYTTNYTPGGNINDATLINITSSFNIPAGPANAYATVFTNSGVYNIPAAVTGNGFFVFEYVGNGSDGPTSTMQIDNIIVN